MSARRIPRQRRSASGLFWSRKSGGIHIPYESALELDFCSVLELDADVEKFESQPLAVEYVRPSGRMCRGFPDFLVTFTPQSGRGTELVDVKCRDELRERWAHLKPRLRAACGYARNRGWRFKLRTEREIRTPFLENAKLLLRYIRDGADPAHEAAFREALSELREATVAGLLAVAFPSGAEQAIALPTLWNMVGRRTVGADLDVKLTMSSAVWSLR